MAQDTKPIMSDMLTIGPVLNIQPQSPRPYFECLPSAECQPLVTVPTPHELLDSLNAEEGFPHSQCKEGQASMSNPCGQQLDLDIAKVLRDWLEKLERRLEAQDAKHEQLLRSILTVSGSMPASSAASSYAWAPGSSQNFVSPGLPTTVQDSAPQIDNISRVSSPSWYAASATVDEFIGRPSWLGNGSSNDPSSEAANLTSDDTIDDFASPRKSKASSARSPKKSTFSSTSKSSTFSSTPLRGQFSLQKKLQSMHDERRLSWIAKESPNGMLRKIVSSHWFDHFISFAIITNAALIGAQTEIAARGGEADQLVFVIIDTTFFAIFSAELVLRIMALHWEFLRSKWNIFDAALVLVQLFELIMRVAGMSSEAQGSTTGMLVRVFRTLRIVRVARLLRFFMQLRVMVKMIIFSLESLFWLMILLLTMMYMVSIVFTQGVTDYLGDVQSDSQLRERLEHSYGNMAVTSFTLFQVITNGQSWGKTCEDLFDVQAFFGALMLLFIFFVFFSVLNVVTGVIVDGAIQHAGQERDFLVGREQKALKEMSIKLMELLNEMDQDHSGTITLDDLVASVDDPKISTYLAAMQIHTPETKKLFNFLDKDGSGEIEFEEFIDGCLRIRGHARNIDLHLLMFQVEQDQKYMQDQTRRLNANINRVLQLLTLVLPTSGQLHGQALLTSSPSAGQAANSSTDENGNPQLLSGMNAISPVNWEPLLPERVEAKLRSI